VGKGTFECTEDERTPGSVHRVEACRKGREGFKPPGKLGVEGGGTGIPSIIGEE
jgi:hypothetical protein